VKKEGKKKREEGKGLESERGEEGFLIREGV
jgi:hypothetical protein